VRSGFRTHSLHQVFLGSFWLLLGIWIVTCVLLSISGYRRLGYVLLKLASAREKTLRVIRQITKRKGWHLDTGIFVIHCDYSFWREIVELCLTCASAAVIDVTKPSQNVGEKELRTKLEARLATAIAIYMHWRLRDVPGRAVDNLLDADR